MTCSAGCADKGVAVSVGAPASLGPEGTIARRLAFREIDRLMRWDQGVEGMSSRSGTIQIVSGLALTAVSACLLALLRGVFESIALVSFTTGLILAAVGWQRLRATWDEERARQKPGWYEDPDSSVRLRFHDGRNWTAGTIDKRTPDRQGGN
jgi:hypothetical protein